jgi:hypothetical protein
MHGFGRMPMPKICARCHHMFPQLVQVTMMGQRYGVCHQCKGALMMMHGPAIRRQRPRRHTHRIF